MTNTKITDDEPGLGVDELKRKDVKDNVFETTLNVEQCRRIVAATRRHDINFRQISDSAKLQLLVETMRKDQWAWTDADPIRLHLHVPSGEVVCSDGQHRLFAAANARRTLRTLVLWGDDWKAGVHVDRNRVRNVSQFLQHEHGLGSATVYVAAARFHLGRLISANNKLAINYSRSIVDDEAIIELILKNTETIRWGINRAGNFSNRGFSFTGAHVFLFELQQIRQEIADQFYEDFMNNDLDNTDPLAQLRRATNRRYSDTQIRLGAEPSINNLVKAYNMRAAGESVSKWHNATNTDVTFPAGFKPNGNKQGATHERKPDVVG
jgi:hypothetical protein